MVIPSVRRIQHAQEMSPLNTDLQTEVPNNKDIFTTSIHYNEQRVALGKTSSVRSSRSVETQFPVDVSGLGPVRGMAPNAKVPVGYIRSTPTDDGLAKSAIERVTPSVVIVNAWDKEKNSWSGSGTIVDLNEIFPGMNFPAGSYGVITNNHVVPKAETEFVTVTLANGRVLKAKVLTSPVNGETVQDTVDDCALLFVMSEVPLPTVRISKTKPEAGDTILTAGHPLGLPRPSFTRGIISQPAQETGFPDLVIQHDAEINPGNSGGALFNLNGELLGTNTFIIEGTKGLSFAVPVARQLEVLEQILKRGEYPRGDLGFSVSALTQFEREMTGFPARVPGAKIDWIDSRSEAAALGLKNGDIISVIESKDSKFEVDIDNDFEITRFMRWMHDRKPGEKVRMMAFKREARGSSVIYTPKVIVITASKLAREVKSVASETLGLTVNRDEAGRKIITGIEQDSPADKAGLEGNKWVLIGAMVNGLTEQPTLIRDMDQLKALLIRMKNSKSREIDIFVSDKDRPHIKKRFRLELSDPAKLNELFSMDHSERTERGLSELLSV